MRSKFFPLTQADFTGPEKLDPVQIVPVEIWSKIYTHLNTPPAFNFNSSHDAFVESIEAHAQAAKHAMNDSKSFSRACKLFNDVAKSYANKAENTVEQAELALSMLKNS